MIKYILLFILCLLVTPVCGQPIANNEELWLDDNGQHINCHGGNILYLPDGKYYWYGEHRVEHIPGTSEDGISLYTSKDLKTWHYEGLVLEAVKDTASDITLGCIMERPKVVYNVRAKKYVMIFHLELRGKGYSAARTGFAVADNPKGPFRFLRSVRPNAGKWPADFKRKDKKVASDLRPEAYKEWWTPQWYQAVSKGLFLKRDLKKGQMSRDMAVYIDDDGKAYHLYSSEENLTLHLAELTNDYLHYTGKYWRIAPGGQNEAPVIFKRNGTYWLIASGCTGWAPNKARLFKASQITGPWEQLECPARGKGADKTFGGQGTYAMPDPQRPGEFIFMADVWTPKQLSHSRHLWIPVTFENGSPVLRQ